MYPWTLPQSTQRLHLLLTADQRGEIGGEIAGCCSLRCSGLPWRQDEHCSLLCRPLHSANLPGVTQVSYALSVDTKNAMLNFACYYTSFSFWKNLASL